MNAVLAFNKGIIPCHYNNLYINKLREELSEAIVCDGYFYLQWMFPVVGSSKWHTNINDLTKEDIVHIANDELATISILESAQKILYYFDFKIEGNSVVCVDNFRVKDGFWLRGIGHEEKKISRIAMSLNQVGFYEIAKELIDLSCETLSARGMKIGTKTNEIIEFWKSKINY